MPNDQRAKGESENESEDVAIALDVPKDVAEMLNHAKAATGRTKKHLVTDAIRSKYSKYLPDHKPAAAA